MTTAVRTLRRRLAAVLVGAHRRREPRPGERRPRVAATTTLFDAIRDAAPRRRAGLSRERHRRGGKPTLVRSDDDDHGTLNLARRWPDRLSAGQGLHRQDHFVYRLKLLLVTTTATVTINVGPDQPTPQPDPDSDAGPDASPTPTPTPPPTPVPTPTPTPTPRPTPSSSRCRPARPPPDADPDAPADLDADPTADPRPRPRHRRPIPTWGRPPDPPRRPRLGVDRADRARRHRRGGTGTGGTGGPGGGIPNLSIGPSAARRLRSSPYPSGRSRWTSVSRSSWRCRGVALVVPGLLLIIAVLAQSLGALAWMPFVRRTFGAKEPRPAAGDGRTPRASRTRWYPAPRRGGRAVDGGALEKRRVERLRGFESHPLRQGLTPRGGPPILRPTSRRTGCERDEYPSHVDPEIRWLVETGDDDDREWTREPPDRTRSGMAAHASRLRRRAPAIQGSADRPWWRHHRTRRSRECGIAE